MAGAYREKGYIAQPIRTATRMNIRNDQAAYLMRSTGRRRPSVPNAREIISANSNMD